MAAAQAGHGDVWLTVLPDPGAARRGRHVSLAPGADPMLQVGREVEPVPRGYAPGEVDVSLRPVGLGGVGGLGEAEEGPYPLGRYPLLFARLGSPPLGLGESGRVYKSWVDILGGKRGRAARLARGAHNPKVGSSNLPPATIRNSSSGQFSGSFRLSGRYNSDTITAC